MKSPIIFRVFKNNQIQFVKQFVDQAQVIIGQLTDGGNQVDIALDSSDVSPIHCLIEKRGDDFYLCDLGSQTGTFKNSQPIIDEKIGPGDDIAVGPFKIVFLTMPVRASADTPIAQTAVSAPIKIVPEAPVASTGPGVHVTQDEKLPASLPAIPATRPLSTPVNGETSTTTASVEKLAETSTATVPPTSRAIDEMAPAPQPAAPQLAPPAPQPAAQVGVPSSASSETFSEKPLERPQTIVKPNLQTHFSGQKNANSFSFKSKRNRFEKTFAPGNAHENLNEFIRTGKGDVIQVITSWNGRVLETKSLSPLGSHKAGVAQAIQLPRGTLSGTMVLIDGTAGPTIQLSGARAEVKREQDTFAIEGSSYKLQQNEVVYLYFANGIQLAIRFANNTKQVTMDSPIILSAAELTGILSAFIIAALTALIVSVYTPKEVKEDEEVQRVAQVIFTKPPTPIKPPAPPPPPEEKPEVKTPEPPKEPEKKVVVAAKVAEEQKTKGDVSKPDAKAQQQQKAGKAAEVKPNASKSKVKQFTSVKQGGAVKTGDTAGANAKSKEPDPMNSGLLSAFGGGGARSKLDKAYSGSGELLGNAEKATGSSGFSETRAGDDLGSKFKDTGAGGKGTATQGIAGVGTKGRGTGMSAYGAADGLGSKDTVQIAAGGAEEEFVGSIDREAVRRAVKANQSAFKACYEREYKKDTKLEGKVVVTWEIHSKGIGKNSRVDRNKSTIGNAAVEECVRERILTIRYPEPPAGTIAEVTYPFVFQGQK